MEHKDIIEDMIKNFNELDTNSNKINNMEVSEGDQYKHYIKKDKLNKEIIDLKTQFETKFTNLENNKKQFLKNIIII